MKLSVNPNDKTPIYRQLYEQIAAEVLSGALSPGTPLPPIRTVSTELGVSMITVRSAWDAMADIKNQVLDLSIAVAEKVVRKQISTTPDQEMLVNDLVKEIKFN